jgi:hypothetical protein
MTSKIQTRASLASLLASALLFAPWRSAWADADSDRARAASRFEEAKGDMSRGDFAGACPKLVESEALDPQVGTLLNLAYCYENVGKTATALSTWMEAASFAAAKRQMDREQFALLRAHWLEPHLLRVTIRVAPQPAYDRIALTIDGVPFERTRWGVPVPMDRGEHELRAEAPGLTSWSSRFAVEEEHPPTIVVPLLAPVVPTAMDPSGPSAQDLRGRPPAADNAPHDRVTRTRPSPLLPFALLAGGATVAALAVASGYGVAALVNAGEANKNTLGDQNVCTPQCQADQRRASHDATVADVSFGVAAAAGVTGLIFWFASGGVPGGPSHASLLAGAAPGSAAIILDGVW